MKSLNKNIVYLLFAASLLSTSTFAQLICNMDDEINRNWFYQVEFDKDIDFSGLAYHPQHNLLFMPLDEPVCPLPGTTGGDEPVCPEKSPECAEDDEELNCPNSSLLIHIRGYDLNKNTDFDVQFSDATENLLKGCDFEGITHLKNDYFAIVEEDENKIYFLEYKPKDQQFDVLHSHKTGIEPIKYPFPNRPCFTFGLGGITYDPNTSRLYVLDEYERKLYSASIVLPGELLPDSSISTEFMVEGKFINSSVNLGDIVNMPSVTGLFHLATGLFHLATGLFHLATGLFHLGQIYPANHPLANNILVTSFTRNTSAEEGNIEKMMEFKISLDQNNDLVGSLELKREVDFNSVEPKPEGIAVIGNSIYVASEWYGLSSYPKKSIGDSCENGYYNQICECVACPPELWINTNAYNLNEDNTTIPLQGLYESSESIETVITNSSVEDVIIRNNEAVDLKSNHITLNKGFKVEAGACLNAEIEPCK